MGIEMKKILMLFILLCSFSTFGQSREIKRYVKMANQYCSQGAYYTCLGLLIRLKKINYDNDKYFSGRISQIVGNNGDEIFDQLQTIDLVHFRSPALYPLIGKRLIEQKEYNKAIRVLALIPEGNSSFALGLHYSGLAYQALGSKGRAVEYYKECIKESNRYAKSSKKEVSKRFKVNADYCKMNIARVFYEAKKYKKSIALWELMDKKSYLWPLTLIEKAWAYYYLKDYNRALGLLVTYKSPLLESYFIPEAEILKALSYYRMCIYDDTNNVMQRFSKIYEPQSKRLKSILGQYRESGTYFFNLAVKSFHKLPKKSVVRKLAVSLFKNPRYERMLNSYTQALKELKLLKSARKPNRAVIRYVSKSGFFIRKSINNYIKRNFFDFINQMHFYSNELFKINLEVHRSRRMIVKKDLEPKKKLRVRGSLKHVKRASDQYFWNFYGGFWADELGGYSFGLKNQCQATRKKGRS